MFIVFQLTRLEIENYNQQTEMESSIEMNQHLQVRRAVFVLLPGLAICCKGKGKGRDNWLCFPMQYFNNLKFCN